MWSGLADQLIDYDAIIFDKDGTLFEVDRLWNKAYKYAILQQLESMPAFDIDLLNTLYQKLGIVGEALAANSLAAMGSVTEVFKVICECFTFLGERPQAIQFFEAHVTEGVQQYIEEVRWLDREIPHLLTELKKLKKPIALITTDSRINTMIMLAQYSVMTFFDYIGCGDDVLPCKPQMHQGKAFLDKYKMNGKKIAMVGDSLYDAQFAKSLDRKSVV